MCLILIVLTIIHNPCMYEIFYHFSANPVSTTVQIQIFVAHIFMNFVIRFPITKTFLGKILNVLQWAVITKTRNRMEQDRTERSVIFRLLTKSYNLGLRILKSTFLGYRGKTVWLQGEESGKERNEIVRSVPFHSQFQKPPTQ